MKITGIFLLLASVALSQTQSADLFVDLHNAPADGTNVDATLLDGASRGAPGTWSISFSNAAAAKVETATTTAPYNKFNVGGNVYAGNTTQRFKYDHVYDQSRATNTFGSGKTSTVVWGFTINTTLIGGSSPIQYDFARTGVGAFSVYGNFTDGGSGGTIANGLRTESPVSSVSTFGTSIRLRLNKDYWVRIIVIPGATNGTELILINDPVTWQLVGSQSGTTDNSDSFTTIGSIAFFQDRTGTNAGYFTRFSNIVVDFSGNTNLGIPEAPGAPTGFTATATGQTTVDLGWANADTKHASIQILRDGAVIGWTSDSATTYTDNTAKAGITYSYKLRAHNIIYDSSETSAAGVTTTAAPKVNVVRNAAIVSSGI